MPLLAPYITTTPRLDSNWPLTLKLSVLLLILDIAVTETLPRSVSHVGVGVRSAVCKVNLKFPRSPSTRLLTPSLFFSHSAKPDSFSLTSFKCFTKIRKMLSKLVAQLRII